MGAEGWVSEERGGWVHGGFAGASALSVGDWAGNLRGERVATAGADCSLSRLHGRAGKNELSAQLGVLLLLYWSAARAGGW